MSERGDDNCADCGAPVRDGYGWRNEDITICARCAVKAMNESGPRGYPYMNPPSSEIHNTLPTMEALDRMTRFKH